MEYWSGKSNGADVAGEHTVLTFDIALCQLWGEIRAKRRAVGKPISPEDAWIAATALHYDILLATHNPTDFDGITGLKVITASP